MAFGYGLGAVDNYCLIRVGLYASSALIHHLRFVTFLDLLSWIRSKLQNFCLSA